MWLFTKMVSLLLHKNDVVLISHVNGIYKRKNYKLEDVEDLILDSDVGLIESIKPYQKRMCYLLLYGTFELVDLLAFVESVKVFNESTQTCYKGSWDIAYDVSILQNHENTQVRFHDISCETANELKKFWELYATHTPHEIFEFRFQIDDVISHNICLPYQSENLSEIYFPVHGFLVKDNLLSNGLMGIYDETK